MIKKHIVSLSGGKDSTAMLLMMLEKNMQIDDIVFCDTGVEFPQMYRHLDKLQKHINKKITIIKREKTFEYFLLEHKRKDKEDRGYGFPYMRNRWCTAYFKRDAMKNIAKNSIEYQGIAYDERERTLKNKSKNRIIKYPLVEWKITERNALEYCYDRGFDWEGLYKLTDRVGCWCCPLCNNKHMKMLYENFPELWDKLKNWEEKAWNNFKIEPLIYYEQKFKQQESEKLF